MAYTISNLKDDLTGLAHSTSLNKVQNQNSLFNRAAKKVLARIDPPTTIRRQQITNAIHDSIYDYSCPADLKGTKIIDIAPQVNRDDSDSLSQRFSKRFDLRKPDNTFYVTHKDGSKSLRLSKAISPEATELHQLNSITANGTWAAGGDAGNLTEDDLHQVDGSACLNFDLDGSGTTGYIEISDMDAIDLSELEDIAQIFVWVYFPDASAITNVILRWGSGSTAYWSDTQTSPHDDDSFKDGWNLIAFDWNGASETGSPDSENVDYIRVTITYDGTADTDLRVDRIRASSGEIWEVEYYSKYLFQTSGGTWQESTTDDSDIINLDTESYNIYTFECLLAMAQQMQGEDASFDIQFAEKELYGDPQSPDPVRRMGLYAKYAEDNPSQAIKPKEVYWRYNAY